jgi:site-specific DNA recombinase
MSNNEQKRKALIYCRVSSDRQKNEGNGLESQETRCRQYAQLHGYEVSRVFKDSFTGGGDFMKRPAMSELLSFVDSNIHENFILIFDDLKRFARDTTSHINLRIILKKKSVEVACLNYSFEDTPEGIFVETIMAAQGQLEKDQNKRQVIQKQKARLEKGYWAFGSPIGYKQTKFPEHGLLLVPKQPEASIIKEAFEGYEKGILISKKDVADFMVSKKFKNQKYIGYKTIDRIFNSSIYAGIIEYPKWEVTRRKGHHEGIISEETFDNVQMILKTGKRAKNRKDIRKEFPLRGLVCSVGSNKTYTASYSKGRNNHYAYYRDIDKSSKFFNKSIYKDVLENHMEDCLKNITPTQEVIDFTEALIQDEWNKRKVKKDIRRQEIQKELNILQKEKDTYMERICKTENENLITAYERKIEALSIDEQSLIQKLNNSRNLLDFGTAFSFVMEYIKNPVKQWQSDNLQDKRTIVQIVFDGIAEYEVNEGFGTAKLAPIYSVFETIHASKSHDVEMGGIEPPCI